MAVVVKGKRILSSGVTSKETGVQHSGTHTAARFFIAHLEDSATVIGYRYAREGKISQTTDADEVVGHRLTLKAPSSGFSDFQKDRFESYGRSLAIWKRMLVEFDWQKDEVIISFLDLDRDADAPTEETGVGWRERVRSRSDQAARSMSRILVGQGFMVREPTSATMVTLKDEFNGTVLIFKYPHSRTKDEAGVVEAYDKWIPMLADVCARDTKTKADALAEGDLTTVFFTKSKNFMPALYEVTPSFRMIVPKRAKAGHLYFASPTYRACRALGRQYKKYFEILRKPMRAWGVEGHSLILEYKKGAGGKVVDDSYLRNVSLYSEKLMKKFNLKCFLQHEPDSRAIIVTFYDGVDEWHTARIKRMA